MIILKDRYHQDALVRGESSRVEIERIQGYLDDNVDIADINRQNPYFLPSPKAVKRYKNAYSLDGSPRFMEEGAGMQKSEKGFWYANSSTWTNEEALMVFRRALNMSVSNNVLMGTPADKPLATDGVFYIFQCVLREWLV